MTQLALYNFLRENGNTVLMIEHPEESPSKPITKTLEKIYLKIHILKRTYVKPMVQSGRCQSLMMFVILLSLDQISYFRPSCLGY